MVMDISSSSPSWGHRTGWVHIILYKTERKFHLALAVGFCIWFSKRRVKMDRKDRRKMCKIYIISMHDIHIYAGFNFPEVLVYSATTALHFASCLSWYIVLKKRKYTKVVILFEDILQVCTTNYNCDCLYIHSISLQNQSYFRSNYLRS